MPPKVATPGGEICVVCLTASAVYAAVPCGHLVFCRACLALQRLHEGYSRCLICRREVGSWLRIFFPTSEPDENEQAEPAFSSSDADPMPTQSQAGSSQDVPRPTTTAPPPPTTRFDQWQAPSVDAVEQWEENTRNMRGLRFYAVWKVPGHPDLAGVHASTSSAFHHFLMMLGIEFRSIRFRSYSSLRQALDGYLHEARRWGAPRLAAFTRW